MPILLSPITRWQFIKRWLAYLKHATMRAIKLIEKRFGGTDQSILLAGHQISGSALLRLLLQDVLKGREKIKNAEIWMVEQQENGSYQLKIYNGKACAN